VRSRSERRESGRRNKGWDLGPDELKPREVCQSARREPNRRAPLQMPDNKPTGRGGGSMILDPIRAAVV
jgi:hypothetical protein